MGDKDTSADFAEFADKMDGITPEDAEPEGDGIAQPEAEEREVREGGEIAPDLDEEETDGEDEIDADDDETTEVEEAEVKTETSEVEPTDAETILALRAQLAEAHTVQTVTPETKTEAATTETAEVKDEVIPEYVTEAEFDAVLEDPKKFNEVMHKAVQAGIAAQLQSIHTGAVEAMQVSIPNMITAQMAQQRVLQTSVDTFYTTHKALEPYKAVVSTNINAVIAKNPEWTLDKVMPEAAELTYKQLQLSKRANETVDNSDAKATGLRKGGKRGKSAARNNKTDSRSALQQEMDTLEFKI